MRTLAILLISCQTVFAAFTHPFVSPGQNYTNTMFWDIYWGMAERFESSLEANHTNEPFGELWALNYWETNNEPYSVWAWWDPRAPEYNQVYDGYTSTVDIVTNTFDGTDYVVTNELKYPVFIDLNDTNVFPYLRFYFSNAVMSFLWTNRQSEVTTNYPSFPDNFDASLGPYSILGLQEIDNGDGFNRFLRHWESDGDDFDTWFQTETNGSGDYIRTLPYIQDVADVFLYTNIGYVTNAVYDNNGGVTTSYWGWTTIPVITQNYNVADIVYAPTNILGTNTAQWILRRNANLPQGNVSSLPVLVHTPAGTNTYVPISLALTGTVYTTISGSVYGRGIDLQTTSSNESVTASDTNDTALTLKFLDVDSFSVPTNAPANTGDTWSVVYKDEFAMYTEREVEILDGDAVTPQQFLYAQTMNEWRSMIDTLRWGWDVCDRYESINASNGFQYVGTSTSSWSEAVSNCLASAPTSAISRVHGNYSWGRKSSVDFGFEDPDTNCLVNTTLWTCTAVIKPIKFKIGGPNSDPFDGLPTFKSSFAAMHTEHEFELYAMGDFNFSAHTSTLSYCDGGTWTTVVPGQTITYDVFNEAWLNTNYLSRSPANYLGYAPFRLIGSANYAGNYIGHTNIIEANICDEPTYFTNVTFRGWMMSDPKDLAEGVIKWDATTNGFRYIR